MNKSLLDKAESFQPKVDLSAVEAAASEYRDLIERKADLEDLLSAAGKAVEEMAMVTLPDLLDKAGVDRIGVPARGNQAAFDVVLRPYYKAVIAAIWSDERKQEAFDALEQHKAGDLIRRVVTIYIPHDDPMAAEYERRMVAMAEKVGLDAEVTRTVPWNSLTSWLRERVEAGRPLPPLEAIGATVGRKATIRDRKS